MDGGLVGACGFARAGREEREIAGRETTGDGTVPIVLIALVLGQGISW